MREVITRRMHHLSDWGRPDLIILDGSVGQLSAIREIVAAEQIPVIGRDKSGDHSKNARVRIVLTKGMEDYEMIELLPDSHIAKLIARIDEESHRFAIQYHTLLKRKDALK
jgi:excinuclease ABC subunit C